MNNTLKSILLIILSGLLYGLSFPPVDLHILIFFSLALTIHIIFSSKNLRRALGRTYLVFFVASLTAISWISVSGMQENADPFLIVAGMSVLVIYPLFFLPAAGCMYMLSKTFDKSNLRIITLLAFPVVWTGFEYLSTWGQITFPWLLSGNSQTSLLGKIQFIEYTGVYGISFWICTISAMIYYAASSYSKMKETPDIKKTVFVSALAIITYFLPDMFNPIVRSEFSEIKKIDIGVIQPNVNPWKKWGGKQGDLMTDYIAMIKEMRAKDPNIKMAVIPETALPYYFKESFFEESYLALKNLCDSLSLPILAGTPHLEYYKDPDSAPNDARIKKSSGEKYDTYNAAVFFEPGLDKSTYKVYHKMKLVPGSERMPYQEHFPFIKNLIEWGVGLGSWQIGRDTILFAIDKDTYFNSAICYESVYPGFFAEFVKRGANFCVIITNDGWWGKLAGTHQHSRYAVLRAIENRRWIARCANTGISSFIDPNGVMYDETNINEKALLSRNIGVIREKTFYSVHGDLFADICIWGTLVIIVFTVGFRRILKVSPKVPTRHSS
ncbi:MAG: apolipoprotein N-acyltransferase [Ignavibacteria bacterium]|nr:apolipoprotein N-acyltransferase [Ignavibacteria bacterium]